MNHTERGNPAEAAGHDPKPFDLLVAIGDSITAGYSATRQVYSWVNILGRLISEFQSRPVRVVNAGISGNLISPRSRAYHHADSGKPSGLERYRRDVIAHDPDLVAISYGLNDMRCGTPIAAFMADMEWMVREIRQETGATIVLLGVYYMTAYDGHGDVWGKGSRQTTRRWNNSLKRFAETNDLIFADVCAAQGDASWSVAQDGVHPNNLGHALIAHRVFEAVATRYCGIGLKCSRDSGDDSGWAEAAETALRTYAGLEARVDTGRA